MSKIFKNMLPYWKGLIIVVALLVVQAWCDLSLPAYTSVLLMSESRTKVWSMCCRRQ